MTAEIKLSEDHSYLKVSGTLNVETVPHLRAAGKQLIKTTQEPLFDLQDVTQCDSAALALLTAWTRDAKKMGKKARFVHLPLQMMAIAKLSALEGILCLE